jgi:hypothetical protein
VIRHIRLEGLKVDKTYEARFADALRTFRHPWVYCPHQKALINLTPIPPDTNPEELLPLIGPCHPPETAQGIAEARLDPVTLQSFDEMDREMRFPGGGSGASNNDSNNNNPFDTFKQRAKQPLPAQKNGFATYFTAGTVKSL